MNNKEKITNYFKENYLNDEKITKLAQKIGVSHSAIVRYCNNLGYSGYKEFKFHQKNNDWTIKYQKNNIIGKNILYSLTRTFEIINHKKIDFVAKTINKYKKITIIADGFAAYIGFTFKRLLRKINIDAELIEAAGDIHFIIPKEKSVFFFISFSGTNRNFIRAIKKIKYKKEKIILFSLTAGKKNNIKKYANETLNGFISQDEIDIKEYPVTAQIVCNAIIGILFEKIYTIEKQKNDDLTLILLSDH